MKCVEYIFTSYMQTVEKTGDFVSTGINTGNKRQCRPEEFVSASKESHEYHSSVGIQIFYLKK